MRLYDETCLALCEGQYIDIATGESDEVMSVDAYFDMIGRKTAALIAGSIEAGALLATDDEDVIARYRGFGWALGIAFQLNDDLLGIWGAEQATGKAAVGRRAQEEDAAGDLCGGARGTRGSRAPAGARTRRREPTAAELEEIVAILERVGRRDYTRDAARRYRDEALAELDAAGVGHRRRRERASRRSSSG